MRLVFFKTPKSKKYNYQPRYYDARKEEWERRKVELGYDSSLSREEQIRLKMSHRWQRGAVNSGNGRASQLISYLVYAFFIVGSVYVILFTDLVEKLLAVFGLVTK